MVVETIMKSNRCYIANSLGFKLRDEDQEDYISYINEVLIDYIEESVEYGFDHIILIGELYCGILFLDCFCRVFNLDSMSNTLYFLGDYFKEVERVTKGLGTKLAKWIIDVEEGSVVEINGPEHFLLPSLNNYMKKTKKAKGKKTEANAEQKRKNSRGKRGTRKRPQKTQNREKEGKGRTKQKKSKKHKEKQGATTRGESKNVDYTPDKNYTKKERKNQ